MAGDHAIAMTGEAAEFIEEAGRSAGVLVTARRTFDIAHAWGGKHPMDVPVVIMTHRVPEQWVNREGSPFTFVTEGVPNAIDVALEIAGDRTSRSALPVSPSSACNSGSSMPSTSILPVVLGREIRLFDHLTKPVDLLVTETSGNPHVTHITYRVIK